MASQTSRAYTRRSFLQSISSLGAAATFAPWLPAATRGHAATPRFAYIATGESTIEVFAMRASGPWTHLQSIPSASPGALALSPSQQFLYAANAIDSFEHRPTGSVEAYRIDANTGRLTHLNRRGLALSATRPSHLAVSPNGQQLAVAVAGGAAYNLLPLAPDGSIGAVTASLKQVGANRPTPQSVVFRDDATLFAVDPGAGRISAFSATPDGALALNQHRTSASGPAHVVLHPEANAVYTAGADAACITTLSYRTGQAEPLQQHQQITLDGVDGGIAALAIDPAGRRLFAAHGNGIASFGIAGDGSLASLPESSKPIAAAIALAVVGAHLYALSRSGSVTRLHIESGRTVAVASVTRPTALAIKHA